MNADQKKFVWRSLLDADQNARYWRAMTLRYVRRERAAKIFLALVASATVAGWGFWREVGWLWQGFSILAALISVALPIFDVPRHVEEWSNCTRSGVSYSTSMKISGRPVLLWQTPTCKRS